MRMICIYVKDYKYTDINSKNQLRTAEIVPLKPAEERELTRICTDYVKST